MGWPEVPRNRRYPRSVQGETGIFELQVVFIPFGETRGIRDNQFIQAGLPGIGVKVVPRPRAPPSAGCHSWTHTYIIIWATKKILGLLAEPKTGTEICLLDKPALAQHSVVHAQRSRCTRITADTHSRVQLCLAWPVLPGSPEATPLVCPPVLEAQFLLS